MLCAVRTTRKHCTSRGKSTDPAPNRPLTWEGHRVSSDRVAVTWIRGHLAPTVSRNKRRTLVGRVCLLELRPLPQFPSVPFRTPADCQTPALACHWSLHPQTRTPPPSQVHNSPFCASAWRARVVLTDARIGRQRLDRGAGVYLSCRLDAWILPPRPRHHGAHTDPGGERTAGGCAIDIKCRATRRQRAADRAFVHRQSDSNRQS